MKRTFHIILIDDYRNGLETFADLLRCWGYTVTPVLSGREAIELLHNGRYDLVITNLTEFPRIDSFYSARDSMIPDMSNIDVLTAIQRKRPTLPVVVFAAYSSSNSAAKYLRHGAADYIRKPFSVEELRVRIESVLHKYAESSMESQTVHT